jgi:hypothetical protein
MSVWAHVVGCIRIDGIKQLGADTRKIESALGPMCTFDEWNDASTLPKGSEGGLQYRIIEYDTGMPWVAIPIWGDLRDFDNANEIETWWLKTLPALGTVRDAVLQIVVDGVTTVLTDAMLSNAEVRRAP